MPADSTTLAEEGVVIPPTLLVRSGELDRRLLDSLTEQMRGPRQREADLRAQLAANRLAGVRLAEIARRHGRELLERAMAEALDYAERRTQGLHRRFPRRHLPGDATCSRTTRQDLAISGSQSACASTATSWRSTSRAPTRRRRQPQLPAVGHQVGRLLRAPRPDRSRHTALGGRLPAHPRHARRRAVS